MLSFIVRKAEAGRDLRELTELEMMSVAGGDDMIEVGGDVCPNGQPPKYIGSLRCTSGGCNTCATDDVSCI